MVVQDILNNWNRTEITDENYQVMIDAFFRDSPNCVGTDTETDGLNILNNKPFLIVFGWINKETSHEVFNIPVNQLKAVEAFKQLCFQGCIKWNFCWNATFDVNMLINIGIDLLPTKKVCDGMSILRLISDAGDDHARKGLKKVAVKYIASDADAAEYELKCWLQHARKARNKAIKDTFDLLRLKDYSEKAWDTKAVKDQIKDYGNGGIYAIPNEINIAYQEVLGNYPEVTYADIPKKLLNKYAALDVILMLEFVKKYLPTILVPVSSLQQVEVFNREMGIIPALIEQIRVGWKVDMPYLTTARKKLEYLIQQNKTRLWAILGERINVGQHKKIALWLEANGWTFPNVAKIVREKNVNMPDYKADKAQLALIKKTIQTEIDKPDIDPEAIRRGQSVIDVCELVEALRTHEKWLSTYVYRIVNNVQEYNDGAFHPEYDQFGAVSGRFTSNSQQFPRGGLYNKGEEIFNPRRAFITQPDHILAYFDYSQIEMRVAAHKTIAIGQPDRNILNVYVNWDNDPNWKPSDQHLTMATNAFDLTPEQVETYKQYSDMPESQMHSSVWGTVKLVKNYRSQAKSANFACVYGGTNFAINASLFENNEPKLASKIYEAFQKTFPGLIAYQAWVANTLPKTGSMTNELGRIYRFSRVDYAAKKKTANYLIQGVCADFLKSRMLAVWNYIKKNEYKTKIIGNIHDELQFLVPNNEKHILSTLKEIMESGAEWCEVPLVVDVETSDTNWADKLEMRF